MRLLGVNLPFADDALRAELSALARAEGFDIRFYDDQSLKAQGAADCEVFFGKMPASMLAGCTALKWFQCSFAGVDDYCDDGLYPNPDVVLTNSAGAYGITISEHLICTLLMMMRNMPKYIENQRRRGWDRMGEMRSIYGSVLTVLGMGDIGTNFARRAKALGAAQVRGVRRRAGLDAPDCYDQVFTADRLDAALEGAEALIVCLPGTDQTRGMIDAGRLQKLRPGAYVLNVGRGSAIDQAAIRQALDAGHLAGAALDVTVPEPLPPSDPLWDAPNLILTPHVSGNMSLGHTRALIVGMFKENFGHYVAGRPLKYVVDRKAGY